MKGRAKRPRRGWRQWREDEARAVLAELAAAGTSLAAFARRRGVSVRRLRYWRARLGRTEVVRFVAVAVPAPPAVDAGVELVVRGVVVRAPAGVAAARLADVAAALVAALPPC